MDWKVSPVIRNESTDGKKITARWKCLPRRLPASNKAKASPRTVFSTDETTVNFNVFHIYSR